MPLAPGFLTAQDTVIAFQRDVEHLPLLNWMTKPIVPGRYATGPTQADISLEGLRQRSQHDLAAKRKIRINQSFR